MSNPLPVGTGEGQEVREWLKRVHPVKAIRFDAMTPTPAYEFLRRRGYNTRYMSGGGGAFYFSHRYRVLPGEYTCRDGGWLVDEGRLVVFYSDDDFRANFDPAPSIPGQEER